MIFTLDPCFGTDPREVANSVQYRTHPLVLTRYPVQGEAIRRQGVFEGDSGHGVKRVDGQGDAPDRRQILGNIPFAPILYEGDVHPSNTGGTTHLSKIAAEAGTGDVH